jgi:hypothetical protein
VSTHLRYRGILLLFICALAVLIPVAIAAAACPLHPPAACGSPGFTGRVGSSSRCGHKPPSVCHTHQGSQGQQGATGKPGPAGPIGATGAGGSKGAVGLPGPQGVQGETGAAGPPGVIGPQGLAGVQGEVGAAGATGAAGPAGETGTSGAPGAPGAGGPAGELGATGPEGPIGPPGAEGPIGPPGAEGFPGPPGADGEVGPQGAAGAEGPQGTTGAAGAAGSTGPAGPPGPAGANGLSQYAYVYNLGGETVPLEADVNFDSNGVLTPGITHALGAAAITLATAGAYEVTFSVSGTEPSQMALFVNGTLVSGTVYGSGAGTQQNTGQAIFVAPAGAVLTVRNHTSSAAVGLATPIGGTQPSANASVVIEKLA